MISALKNPSIFRPSSRPSSPVPAPRPEPVIVQERTSRPLTKLSLSNFRRPSPSTTLGAGGPVAPLVQDGSYLEMLGLKLGEAVSRALAQPLGPAAAHEQVNGKRPIPAGRGQTLGALIASELKATSENTHLNRTIIRFLHRPLSVLLTNLSAHLLPVISSPAFLIPPAPTTAHPNPNATQIHALSLATFAGELLESFDELGLGLDNGDIRGDGLKPIREGLVSVITRVVNPLVGGLKNELLPLIDALETVPASAGKSTSIKGNPSIVALQGIVPVYSKALTRYTTSLTSQPLLASFLISVVWRGMVAIAHRHPFVSSTPPGSPGLAYSKPKRGSPPISPPLTPSRFAIKLPPSRPPSPPAMSSNSAATDARALLELLSLLPRPSEDRESTRLAREAVDEAFDGLKALAVFMEFVQSPFKGVQNDEGFVDQLTALSLDLPTLICLPVLLNTFAPAATIPSVAGMIGLTEEGYRRGCLSGFGRAEECAPAVGQRVLDTIRPNSSLDLVVQWLEVELAGEQ